MGHESRKTLFVFSHEGRLYAVLRGDQIGRVTRPPSFYLSREDGREVQIDAPMVAHIREGLHSLDVVSQGEPEVVDLPETLEEARAKDIVEDAVSEKD
jgi:hypothetical protein